MENTKIYNDVRNVPKSALKNFNNGRFAGTDINPMWRIEKMTEIFGPCGVGWYFGKPDFTAEMDGQTKTIHCTVALFIKQDNGVWSAPIYGVGGNTLANVNKSGVLNISDEGYKMAYTDAQSNACKLLGVGADVWFDASETKYTATQKKNNEELELALKALSACKTLAEVKEVWIKNTALQSDMIFKSEVAKKGKELKEKEAVL